MWFFLYHTIFVVYVDSRPILLLIFSQYNKNQEYSYQPDTDDEICNHWVAYYESAARKIFLFLSIQTGEVGQLPIMLLNITHEDLILSFS